MKRRRFCSSGVNAGAALAAACLLLSPAGAIAVPKRLDCTLTELETKAGSKSDFAAESRSITVVFDEQAQVLSVYQDGGARVLNNVTISETSMNGYVGDISLGIATTSGNMVIQTYAPGSTRAEFGACSPSAEPLP